MKVYGYSISAVTVDGLWNSWLRGRVAFRTGELEKFLREQLSADLKGCAMRLADRMVAMAKKAGHIRRNPLGPGWMVRP